MGDIFIALLPLKNDEFRNLLKKYKEMYRYGLSSFYIAHTRKIIK